MSNKDIAKYVLVLDREMYEKLKEVCDYNGRSIRGQLIYWIRRGISEYEKEREAEAN